MMLKKKLTWIAIALLAAPVAIAEKISDPDERAEYLLALSSKLESGFGEVLLCLDYAQNAGLQNDHDAALDVLDGALAVHPEDPRLIAEKARHLMRRYGAASAVALCQEHLADNPGSVEVEIMMLFARSFLPGEMRLVADRAYELVQTEEYHDNPDLREAVARLYGRYDEFENAANMYKACLEVDPIRPNTLYDAAGLEASCLYRPDRALAHLLRHGELQPQTTPWVTVAKFCIYTGDISGAVSALETSIGLDHRPGDARAMLGNIYTARFELGRAIEVLSDGLINDPNNVEILLSRSAAYFDQGSPERAMEDVRQVISLSPDDPRPYRNSMLYHARRSLFEAAVADADKALLVMPHDRPLRDLREQLVEAQQDEAVARRVLARLAPHDPGYHAAMSHSRASKWGNNHLSAALHATVALELAGSPSQSAAALVERATALSVMRWRELSIIDYEAALACQPDNLDALLSLSKLLVPHPGRLEEAEEYSRRALELAPNDIQAQMSLVNILIFSERYEEAEAALESLPIEHDQQADVLRMWATLFERQGYFSQAADCMASLDDLHLLTEPGLERWAYYLKRSGRYADAEVVCSRIVQQSPGYVDGWVATAVLRVMLGDFGRAGEALEHAYELEPHSFLTDRAWSSVMVLAALDGINAALPYVRLLQHDSVHFFDADQVVMWCLLFEGRPDEALEYADHWRENAPPEEVLTGDDIPLRYFALLAMDEDDRAQAVLSDPTLQEHAGRPAVRAWLRLQERTAGEYLPAEAFDDAQGAEVERVLPFFVAMQAAIEGDDEAFVLHIANLQRNQFDSASVSIHLIIAYIIHQRGGYSVP